MYLKKEFSLLLHKYQNITNMSDRRINRICALLNERIETETNTNHIKLNTFKTNRTNTPNKNECRLPDYL